MILTNLAAFGQYYSDNRSAEVSKGLTERAAPGTLGRAGTVRVYKKWLSISRNHPRRGRGGSAGVLDVRVGGRAQQGLPRDSHLAEPERPQDPVEARRRPARRYLWTHYSVSGILSNPFYLGQIRYKVNRCQAITHCWYHRNSSMLSGGTERTQDRPNGRTYQRADVLDEQTCAIIGNLRLPQSWRELVSGTRVGIPHFE